MVTRFVLQFLTLSLYTFCMGFLFCDGFGMRNSRKMIFNSVLLVNAFLVIQKTGEFRLEWILPIPTLMAIGLCWAEKKRKQRSGEGG